MLRDLKKNNEGLVLVTVLMIIIVMLVLSTTMLSLNISQVMTTETEVKRIQAETLARGVLSYAFFNQMADPASQQTSYGVPSETLDNVEYTISATRDTSPSGIYGTNPVIINISY